MGDGKKVQYVPEREPFDPRSVPHQKWSDFEQFIVEQQSRMSFTSSHMTSQHSVRSQRGRVMSGGPGICIVDPQIRPGSYVPPSSYLLSPTDQSTVPGATASFMLSPTSSGYMVRQSVNQPSYNPVRSSIDSTDRRPSLDSAHTIRDEDIIQEVATLLISANLMQITRALSALIYLQFLRHLDCCLLNGDFNRETSSTAARFRIWG